MGEPVRRRGWHGRATALQSTTIEAYRALWQLLFDFDLTKRIVAVARPADEPLRWMLRNPPALRVTRQSDNLWVRLLDVPTALEARTYDVAGSVTCTPTNASPDLTLDVPALGSLYLGGASAALLASAGRIHPHRADAVATLSRLFRVDPEPFNSFAF
ncbi:sterol carrier protein domain-containing protein [Phytoactinopolyspora limicola]|uniref:sterol carrier protein domain-containing protein n=1 Tax=Phytoactinopolyspora limicola TaxID=2715536 RepID=UPI001FE76B67